MAAIHLASEVILMVIMEIFTTFTASESISSTVIYTDNQCSETPLVASIVESVDCTSESCSEFTAANGKTYYTSVTCVNDDRETYVDDTFNDSSYLLIETYSKKCTYFMGATAFIATGGCQIYSTTGGNSVRTVLNGDGSACAYIYNDTSCSGESFLSYTPDSEYVSNHSCFKNYNVFYASTGNLTISTGGAASLRGYSSTIVGVAVLVLTTLLL